MGNSKGSPEREVHSTTSLPKEARKISNNKSKPTPQTTRKKQCQTTLRVTRRKEIIKIRVEINDKKLKKMIIQLIKKTQELAL